ncbi:MAG: transposase [Verrucomicrobiales bacterium]|nr:transposase [Verrucomicrobiales bacterium]
MPKTRPAYTEEFRQQAVQLLLDSGRPLDRVAAELGVSANSLRSWRDRSLGRGRGAQAPSTQSKGRSATPPAHAAEQIRQLHREVHTCRQRDILKSHEHTGWEPQGSMHRSINCGPTFPHRAL